MHGLQDSIRFIRASQGEAGADPEDSAPINIDIDF